MKKKRETRSSHSVRIVPDYNNFNYPSPNYKRRTSRSASKSRDGSVPRTSNQPKKSASNSSNPQHNYLFTSLNTT